MRISGFDIGTNTVRAVVLFRSSQGWESSIYLRRITRLGEGLERTGMISEEALERTVQALREMRDVVKKEGAERICAGATYSLRRAENAEEVLRVLEDAIGVKVEVISSDEEAKLMARGVFLNLPLPERPVLCVDIGGGSTEVVRVEKGEVKAFASLKLGLVHLAESYLTSDPPGKELLGKMEDEIYSTISESGVPFSAIEAIYGNCGTFSTLAMMVKNTRVYSRKELHGSLIPRRDFEKKYAQVVNSKKEERLSMRGVERGREDLIVAGFSVIKVLFRLTGAERIVVSEEGWLEAFTVERCGG